MSSLARLKREFLEYLEIEKNRSIKTVRNYDFYLNRFLNWARIHEARDITLPLVKKYRLWLNRLENKKNPEGLAKHTQNYHVIALRSFLKYLAKMDITTLAAEKIELGREPEREVTFLDTEELKRLLDAPLKNKSGEKTPQPLLIQLRDKALLELLFSTGLRVSEAANLRTDQINLKRDEFTIRGKGSKLRVVFLADCTKHWLKTYIEKRTDTSLHLFVSFDRAKKKGERAEKDSALTSRSIQRLIEKYAQQAGIIKHVTPHSMRHTFATDLLRNGADIRSVQALLGHSSITTTQIYTHITDQRLRETHKRFHNTQKN